MKTTVAGSLIGVLMMVSAASAGDWPQFRGPLRDGKCTEKGVIRNWETNPPQLLWNVEGTGAGYASVAVVGDRLFTTGDIDGGQAVIALSAKDGKVLWSTVLTNGAPKHGYEGARCTPTVVDGRICVTTSDGTVACLDTDGKILWKKDFKAEWNGKMMSGWGFSETPLIDGDRVICTPGGPDALMVALDRESGKEIWRCKPESFGKGGKDGSGYGSAVISNAAGVKQYVQMTGRGVVGVRASDGRFLWGSDRAANNVANISMPVVFDDHVFYSTAYGAGSALLKLEKDGDGVKASEVYFIKADVMQNHHGGMVLVDGRIYCGHRQNGGDPVCLDVKTGKILWGPEKGPGKGSAAVLYVDGHVIFRYQDGTLALVEANPGGFKLKGSFMPVYQKKESWAYPVVSGGLLYLREQDRLMCYKL